MDSRIDEIKSIIKLLCNAAAHDAYIATSMEDIINLGSILYNKVEKISSLCKQTSDGITKHCLNNK